MPEKAGSSECVGRLDLHSHFSRKGKSAELFSRSPFQKCMLWSELESGRDVRQDRFSITINGLS